MPDLPFAHITDQPLASLCTLGVGGKARYFCECRSVSEGAKIVVYCHGQKLPLLILGKGSNALFDDKGFNGLVLLNRIEHIKSSGDIFRVGSGYSFARLGSKTVRAGLSGLEFAAGIPASVGGAIFMNAGANSQCTADTLTEVSYITHEGELCTRKKQELEFGYRFSSFQNEKSMIVEAVFALAVDLDAKERQIRLLGHRLNTQPYKQKSAGCAFRNPQGDKSAGYLIAASGLKGFSIGGAKVSTLHANFIVNEGSATAEDVRALLTHIKGVVLKKQGVLLEQEIRTISYEL